MRGLVPDFFFQPEPIIWVQQFFGYGHPLPFRVLDLFAATWGVLFAIGLALWLWGRDDAYALAAIVVLEALINLGLNQLFSVPRPTAPEIVKYEQIQLGSFPSGHMFTVTVLWGLLWVRDRVPLWLSTLIILGVGVGRLYLGVHYLADVVAGVVLGVLLVWLFRKIWPPVRHWLAERSYGFFVVAGLLGIAAVTAGLFLVFGQNPFMWNAAGILAAGIIALLVEYRYVCYTPEPPGLGQTAVRILIGLAGLVPLLVVDRITGEDRLWVGAGAAFVSTLWALWLVPLILQHLQRSRRERGAREGNWHAARAVLLTLGAWLVASLLYGTAVEPRLILDVDREPAPIPDLPTEWQGRTVAVIADFQVGMWWANTGMMRRVVEKVIEESPAVVLLAGDFVYQPGPDPSREVDRVMEILQPLARSGIPTYAVLGNHDWGLNQKDGSLQPEVARRMREALESAGIPVLHNQAIPLGSGNAPLYLVGIGSEWAEEARPREALQAVPAGAPRLVFMHNPDSFREIPAGAAPLAVAAHTHGGQIRIPGTPSWSWLGIVAEGEATADGWIQPGYGQPGNRLYVNRGIGFSTIPIRINCPPHLTVFELERGAAHSAPHPGTGLSLHDHRPRRR